MEYKAKDHVYIWDLYPTIREGKLEFPFLSTLNTITQAPLTSSCNPSHIIPNLSICATLLSTILLLPPPYCNPSCCPLASLLLHKHAKIIFGTTCPYCHCQYIMESFSIPEAV